MTAEEIMKEFNETYARLMNFFNLMEHFHTRHNPEPLKGENNVPKKP